ARSAHMFAGSVAGGGRAHALAQQGWIGFQLGHNPLTENCCGRDAAGAPLCDPVSGCGTGETRCGVEGEVTPGFAGRASRSVMTRTASGFSSIVVWAPAIATFSRPGPGS